MRSLQSRVYPFAIVVLTCFALAGCAGKVANSDDNRRGGFYGGVSGGMLGP